VTLDTYAERDFTFLSQQRSHCVQLRQQTAHVSRVVWKYRKHSKIYFSKFLIVLCQHNVDCLLCDVGFFDQAGSAVEKEFHKVANALSYEYRFAHSHSRHERYRYMKWVISILRILKIYFMYMSFCCQFSVYCKYVPLYALCLKKCSKFNLL